MKIHRTLARRLLAALPLLAAGPALADSSLTLYGRINTSIERQKLGPGGGRTTQMVDNASRFGLKGTEDLGGGLRAGFVLESGFDATSGASATPYFGRESSVHLSGALGTLKAGLWLADAYLATADYVSLHNHDTGSSADALYAFGTGFAMDHKIGYSTPSLGGFTGQVAFADGHDGTPDTVELSGNYIWQERLHLGFGASKQGDGRQLAARALYFTGPFVVGGYVQHERVAHSPHGNSRMVARLVGMYGVGPSEWHVNLGWSGKGGTQADAARQYTLAYNHKLSKRTKLYGFYTALRARGSSPDFDALGVGIRHNF